MEANGASAGTDCCTTALVAVAAGCCCGGLAAKFILPCGLRTVGGALRAAAAGGAPAELLVVFDSRSLSKGLNSGKFYNIERFKFIENKGLMTCCFRA